MRGQRHAPATPYLRERPGTHCTGGWVGHRAGLDRCGKSGIRSRTVQPVGSRYTHYATWLTCILYDYVKCTIGRHTYSKLGFMCGHYIHKISRYNRCWTLGNILSKMTCEYLSLLSNCKELFVCVLTDKFAFSPTQAHVTFLSAP